MEPIFTDKQLNNMSREDLISLMKIVQAQTKKKDTEIQLLKDKQKELEFLNAMLSDRLTRVRSRDMVSQEDLWLTVPNITVMQVPMVLVLIRARYSKENTCQVIWEASR